MNRKRNLLIFVGAVILLAALVSGFVLMQTSAEDVLVNTLETMETIDDAHAVVELNLDSVEKSGSATIELWARQGEDGPGAFRMHVLKSSEEDAAGAVFVSDGETVWAYKPSENQVIVGTAEEAKAMMAEQEFGMGNYDWGEHEDGDYTQAGTDSGADARRICRCGRIYQPVGRQGQQPANRGRVYRRQPWRIQRHGITD
jgi:hypothetical protein